jgi:hypothetical protein
MIDQTGKRSGRGAYLCAQRSCWELALKKGRLGHALRKRLTPEVEERLQEYAENLPQKAIVMEEPESESEMNNHRSA